ncbi:MAG: CfrBI family restriction endonuclease [Treponema sp.]|nr:CfrBI family restriction endonuclease [Treponema sp.]
MTLKDHMIKNIVISVLKSQDYRIEVVNLINAEFLQFALDFFKQIVDAKLHSNDITIEWYKTAFMNETLSSDDIAINSGLNKKTISNMYRSDTKQIVVEDSNEYFDLLYDSIKKLIENEKDVDLSLTIKFQGVSVDLNINESLIIINTLAVKRAALRGGLWSTVGKRVEKYLMLTLCKLYNVDEKYYTAAHFIKNKELAVDREVDFY